MRLIDADSLKRLVEEEWFDCKEKSSFFDEIDRTPTIEPKREIEEFKAQAYAEGFTTALGAILDMLKGATKYENCKLYNEGYKDGESVED